jgi:signal transduction histidine kinase
VQPGLEVMADAQLVTLLLDQLLSNAWKFTATRERARITVDAVSSGGDRVLRVADNGVGFHPHDAGRIFRLFTRLEGAEAFDGSGVGLALAWRIVERHGGLIWAHGDPGQGATFFVRL